MAKSTKLKFLASQNGLNNPTMLIQETELWFTPTFTRVGVGEYVLNIPGITHENINVTYSSVGGSTAGESKVLAHEVNENGLESNIQFFTFWLGDPADGILGRTAINIEIFHGV